MSFEPFKNRIPIILQNVKEIIEHKQRRKLTFTEQTSLYNYISNLPATHRIYNDSEIEKIIFNNWVKAQHSLINQTGIIDTHELLKKNIGLNSETDVVNTSLIKSDNNKQLTSIDLNAVLGKSDMYDIQRILNPQALYTKTQILLDSRYRSLDTDGTSILKWSFANNLSPSQGFFNTSSPIRDIISIKIFPFKIPYSSTIENPTKNVTIYYNEFSNQCVPVNENRKYHHWLEYTKEDDWISLNPHKYNKGVYNFDIPITTLESLTLTFGAPLKPIKFDIDRLLGTFTIGNPTTITFNQIHNLDSGYTIFFTDFTTTNPSNDKNIINLFNSSEGLEVTRISSTEITVPINTTSIVGTMIPSIAFFNEKRMYIPIEITYIRPKF